MPSSLKIERKNIYVSIIFIIVPLNQSWFTYPHWDPKMMVAMVMIMQVACCAIC